MASFAEPDLSPGFGAAHSLLPAHTDDHFAAHSLLGEQEEEEEQDSAFANEEATTPGNYQAHDLLSEDDQRQSTSSSLFSAPTPATTHAAARSSVSDILRASMSRAVAREYAHSIGHPHSLLGATPYSSPPNTNTTNSREVTQLLAVDPATVPWGEVSVPADASRRSPDVEQDLAEHASDPFDFESPTRLSTDEHLAVPRSEPDLDMDVDMELEDDTMHDEIEGDESDESDEPEVPETSLPSVQDLEEQELAEELGPIEEQEGDLTFEEEETTHLDEETAARDRLEYSARAASVILGDDTRAIRLEQARTLFQSLGTRADLAPDEVEEAIVDDEQDIEQALDTEDAYDQGMDDHVTEEHVTEEYIMEEPAGDKPVEDEPAEDEPAVEEQLVSRITTLTTVERVPLKRSVEELAEDDPSHTTKRRRRRSFAEMLEADARPIIDSVLSERSRRHASVAASVAVSVAPETPSKQARERRKSFSGVGTAATTATPRGRGRPRKSDIAPNTTRSKSIDPTTPRKRGRPPKAATGARSASKPPPTPGTGRKRGRPSLASLALQSQELPSKPLTEVVATPKARRGRPRKSVVPAAPDAEDTVTPAVAVETPLPKRRGRPPKRTSIAQQEPAYNEPTYNEPAYNESALVAEAEPIPDPVQTATPPEEPATIAEKPPARRRGRPPKAAPARPVAPAPTVPVEEPTKKRKRATAETSNDEPQRKTQKTQPAPQVKETKVAPVAPPKRRGRPPKVPRAQPVAAAPDTDTVAPTVGKATYLASTKASRAKAEAAKSSNLEQAAAPEAPRRRGRPRKI